MSNIKSAFVVLGITLLTLISSWLFVPLLNSFFANLVISITDIEYWDARFFLDILNTFTVFSLGSWIVVRLTKKHPVLISIPVGLTGLIIFYIELGGFHCLGVCGPPLWYDIASFFKHISASLIVGLIIYSRRSHQANV